MPRHGHKRVFAGFQSGRTTFAVLFLHFGGIFASIGGTVTKILDKTYVGRLRNRFYGIRRSIFSPLEVILRRLKIPLPRYGLKRVFARFKTGITAFAILFFALLMFFASIGGTVAKIRA